MTITTGSLAVYIAGVIIGLAVMRDPCRTRLLTAALWPLGPAAFVLVLVILTLAAAYLWPVPILGAAALVAVILWLAL
jgi:hypothetical protein